MRTTSRRLNLFVLAAALAAPGLVPAPAAAQSAVRPVATSGDTDTPRDTARRVPPPGDYRLNTGDKLRIEVYKDAQLSQSLQVRPDGKITMPLIGDIPAAGRTPLELRDTIATALKEYVNNPVVTVIVVEAQPPTVFVMGEVNKPGTVAMTTPITVVQALAMAGGFKEFANTKDIRVLRRETSGVQTIHFNYNDAVKGEGDQAQLYLRPGDTVVVR